MRNLLLIGVTQNVPMERW